MDGHSDAFLARALRSGPAAVVLCDSRAAVNFASDRAAQLLGVDPVGRRLGSIVDPGGKRALLDYVEALAAGRLAGGKPVAFVEVDFDHPTYGRRVLHVEGRALEDGGRQVLALVLHDDSGHHHRERPELARLSGIDPLTQVGDWRSVADRLRIALRAAEAAGADADNGTPTGCIAVLTVDRLKPINDRLGFQTGDEVLKTVAGVLRTSLPGDTWTARVGGDEFVCLFPHQDVHTAADLLRQALDDVRAKTLLLTGQVEVTFSAGLAALVSPDDEDVMLRADVAAFQAQAEGGGCVVVHGPGSDVWLGDRRKTAAEVERLESRAQSLESEARTDALTGLPNRRALEERFAELDATDAGRRRSQDTYAVLFVDADHFGRYNHAHGDAAGDAALQVIARVLEGSSRAGDEAYRKGGEEFVLILPGADLGAGRAVADRVRRDLEALGVRHDASPTAGVLTVTIGVSVAKGGLTASQVCDQAGAAAYAAKEAGRRNSVNAST